MGHRSIKKYSFHEAHFIDQWQELKGQLWSSWAENQRLKRQNEQLKLSLDEITMMYQKLILEKKKCVKK